MTDKADNARALVEALPERYRLLESGAVLDKTTGRIVAMSRGGGTYGFTKETAKDGHQAKREEGIIRQLRGLATTLDIELPPDADLAEIVKGAGSTVEALTRHMAQTFLQSKNLRGMAETYSKLVAPLIGEPSQERDDVPADIVRETILQLARLARQANDAAITGDVINVTPE